MRHSGEQWTLMDDPVVKSLPQLRQDLWISRCLVCVRIPLL